MITILISWLLIFYMISVSGIAIKNRLKLTDEKAFIPLYGIVFQTLFIGIAAFFYKIEMAFFIVNSLLIVVLSSVFRNEVKLFFATFFKSLNLKHKTFFGIIILLTAFKSAQVPTIFDNESYYIQTIKWLNEYGYVKGIANVHPFLAQCSFWHVFQSGFNFSFIAFLFNDVNGLLVLIGVYYFLNEFAQKSNVYLVIYSLLLVFYFQFIDAPSPDLPILVFCSILFYEFIFKTLDAKKSKTLLLFILFICFIKLTVAPLLLLTFFLLKKQPSNSAFFITTGLVLGTIWILKNSIITGLPLFPLNNIDLNLDWKMAPNLLEMVTQGTIDAGYAENLVYTKNLNIIEKLNLWIHLKGLNAVFNIGVILLFILVPFSSFFKKFKFRVLYFSLWIHFLFLLITSPQYRFFLPIFILFLGIILYDISNKIKFFKNTIAILSVSFIALIVSVLVDLKSLNINNIHFQQILVPESNSKYKNVELDKISISNFEYYNAQFPSLFETSNGALPCVSKRLLEYYRVTPQQRTSDIKDGFYAKEIKNE